MHDTTHAHDREARGPRRASSVSRDIFSVDVYSLLRLLRASVCFDFESAVNCCNTQRAVTLDDDSFTSPSEGYYVAVKMQSADQLLMIFK